MANTKKGRVVHDSFEQVAELGKGTARELKDAVGSFSPLNFFENISTQSATPKKEGEEGKKQGDHTPIDVEGLEKQYEGEDKQKEQALRQKLFRMVKQGEEDEVEKKKREEQEKIRAELQEEQQKKEDEKKLREQQDIGGLPQGKVRRSIFSPKKKAQMQHAETKPSVGKS